VVAELKKKTKKASKKKVVKPPEVDQSGDCFAKGHGLIKVKSLDLYRCVKCSDELPGGEHKLVSKEWPV